MSPLNRALRPRKRRLPQPPTAGRTISPTQGTPPPFDRGAQGVVPATSRGISPQVIPSTSAPYRPQAQPKTQPQVQPQAQPNYRASYDQQSLYSELSGVLRQGVDSALQSPSMTKSDQTINYAEIKRRQLKRAVDDYEAAGVKLADAGLFSNAAISFGCGVLAEFMAENSAEHAFNELQKVKALVKSPQILHSSFFELLQNIFQALAQKDKRLLDRQIEKLKLVETFSADDQELLANAAEFLASKL